MSHIKPPKYVRQVLVTLQGRGFPAYLVGGCVRDMLLGVRPQDWDVCTGALPEQLLEIFPGSRPTGLQHTTFRTEGSYTDHRHPDMVQFVGDLTADLSRRDFTMNAIAISADGLIADPFGGAEDIRRQVIRCVGDPEKRFEEDALRMFRALRFSARLGFTIDLFTMEGIRAKASLAAFLAAERVRDELEKLLLTRSPETVFSLVWLGLLTRYLSPGLPDPALLQKLDKLPRKAQVRWAGLCHVLGAAGCIPSAEGFLTALRLDHSTVRMASDTAGILAQRPGAQAPAEALRRGHAALRPRLPRRLHRRPREPGAAPHPEKRRMLLPPASGRERGRPAGAGSARPGGRRDAGLPAGIRNGISRQQPA